MQRSATLARLVSQGIVRSAVAAERSTKVVQLPIALEPLEPLLLVVLPLLPLLLVLPLEPLELVVLPPELVVEPLLDPAGVCGSSLEHARNPAATTRNAAPP